MRSTILNKAENKNQSTLTSSFKKREDVLLAESHETPYAMSKGPAFNFGNINVHSSDRFIRVQPKLKINEPGDKYEQEADAMADKVMRMNDNNTDQSTNLRSKNVSSIPTQINFIQRDDDPKKPVPATTAPSNFTLPTPPLLQQPPVRDYLAMKQPFFNRNVLHLWDLDAADKVWEYNFNFFRGFGLSSGLSTSLTNFTAPRAIDSQLKADNPTWWEITDRELNTTSFVGSVPILDFDADFSPHAPAWLKSLFKSGGNQAQRKVARKGVKEQPVKKETNNDATIAHRSTEGYINSINVKGSSLGERERNFFETRFGYDFSDVKVHANEAASQSAEDINALAYTYGNNIIFGENQYQPNTETGKTLIAHELTHVIQQQNNFAPAANVMRAGKTVGGFFSNLFHFGNYSRDKYDTYLKSLNETGKIQNDFNSDDLARQIIEQWKADKSNYGLTPKIKVLLVREIIQGHVSNRDQDAVMDLLNYSDSSDLAQMFNGSATGITYAEIYFRFDSHKPDLKLFNERVLGTLGELKAPNSKDAKSIEQRLTDAEKKQGVEFKDISVSFHLAGGKYYKSFLVDIVAPDEGVDVTATLTRASFKVRISPPIVADVIWPIPNADLYGFTLTFSGLKTNFEIDGIDLVSGLARNKVTAYLKDLLAGTRFEKSTYDPTKDPNLIDELSDNKIIGDINRVRYNFERNFGNDKKDSKVPESISGFSLDLNIEHKTGMPIPSSGYGVMIPPGTKFNLHVSTSGTAAELMKKNSHLEYVKLSVVSEPKDLRNDDADDTDNSENKANAKSQKTDPPGIYLYKGKLKIASLTSVEVDKGLQFKLGGIQTYTDLKKLAVEESPGWLKGAVRKTAGVMKGYDDAVDTWHKIKNLGGILGSDEPSDVAKDIAVGMAPDILSWQVKGILRDHWKQLQDTLGVSDKQINQFFGFNTSNEN